MRRYSDYEKDLLERFFKTYPYRFGRQWIIASRALCEYLIYSDDSRSIFNTLRTTFIPDESFVQSVVAAAPVEKIGGTHRNNFRYFLGEPIYIDDTNFHTVVSSDALFARKLGYSNTQKVVDWVNENVSYR